MKKHPLWPFFFLSLFFTFYLTALFPKYILLPFSPFLITASHYCSLAKSLWLATVCGLIMDLVSSLTPFGFHALTYVIVTFFLYRFRLFFVEKALGIISFTALFSFLSTFLGRVFLSFFGIPLPFIWPHVITDFLLMPILDGLYAFLCFSCPLMFYHFLRQQWFRFLFLRKETKKKKEKTVG